MDALLSAFSPKQRNSEAMSAFGFRLKNQFSQNKAYRRFKELEWLESLRQIKGIYDPDVKIEANNSKVYPKITRSKVNIVLSRLHEMLFPDQDKNWEISPTPEPRIAKEIVTRIAQALIKPPEIDPQTGQPAIDPQTGQPSQPILPTEDELRLAIGKFAKETCGKMSSEIDDQLVEMDYSEETKKVLRSGLMYGTGIMKGPMITKRTKRVWHPIENGIDYEEQVDQQDVPDLQFVRIWDWYPDMSVVDVDKMTGSFERHIMNKHDIRQLLKRPDFYSEMIEQFLKDHPDGDYTPANWETDLQVIEIEAGLMKGGGTTTVGTGSNDERNSGTNRQLGKKYEVLEFWGYVDGHDLEACGLDIPDVTIEYAANIWILGDKPIKAALFPTALDQYKVFYYEKDETSIFGEGLARIMRHSQLAIAAAARMVLDNSACLTGDTKVYRNSKVEHGSEISRSSVITLQELWDTKSKYNSGLRRMKIRSVDEETGEIFYNRIVDVYNNGVRSVFEIVTQKGYKIKATEDHRFMCDDGDWQEVKNFCLGDLIAVNGKHNRPPGVCLDCGKPTKGSGIRCRSCAMIMTHPPDVDLPKKCIECGADTALRGVRCKKCAAKFENNKWNQKEAEDAVANTDANESSARQRWACQKDKKDSCERCGAKADAGVTLHIHHKDRNPYNNDSSNKLTLCPSCHMWIHVRHDYFGQPFQHKYVDYDEIVSIEYMGEEMVFDVEVESPNHNFIANGFVVHNCVAGPQVEVNWSLMTPDTDLNSMYPRKIWFREGKGVDAQYPALRVYNIDSHIDELLKVIEAFKSFGDEETTLPTWMIGQMVNNETAQATSGRLAMITVSIKDVVKNFDAFTEKIIRDLYAWNMEFNPRAEIKGDYLCKARGVSSLVMKEIRMQALTQLTTTMTPEEWDYIPKREFLQEKFKAHDIMIPLLSEEEVQKLQQAREQSAQMQLAVEMQKAEIGYKKSQTMAQLTKAKEHNVKAVKDAQTPPEIPAGENPELQNAEVQGVQTDNMAKEAEIRRAEEKHALDMQHQQEKHSVGLIQETAKTSQDMELKGRTMEHGLKMKEKMTEAGAKAKIAAAKKKPAVKKTPKVAK